MADQAVNEPSEVYSKSRQTIHNFVRLVVKPFVCLLVLATLVASKVSITTMLARLHSMASFGASVSNTTHSSIDQDSNTKTAIRLYWQLLIILAVPNLITWVRSLFNGIVGKSSTQPSPKCKAIIGGIVLAALEAVSETALLFCGWILVPPEISLFLRNGMFIAPTVLNIAFRLYRICAPFCKKPYQRVHDISTDDDNDTNGADETDPNNVDDNYVDEEDSLEDCKYQKRWCILNNFLQVAGLLFQLVGMVLVCTFIGFNLKNTASIITVAGTAVVSLLLSAIWAGKVQKMLTIANVTNLSPHVKKHDPTARWKANFIAATVRLILYPFASYSIFRYTYRLNLGAKSSTVDPWCLQNGISLAETFTQWEFQEVIFFAMHIICSFLAYSFSWIACFMTLHKYGLAIPVILATPASVGIFVLMVYLKTVDLGFKIDRIFDLSVGTSVHIWLILAFSFAVLLWVGQCMITTLKMWKTKNVILASDKDMFVRPYYSSILLEQYLILNRDVPQSKNSRQTNRGTVFICSTMFRENATEMKQILLSLRRVAAFYKSARNGTSNNTKYESHIFFDGGCNGEKILPFGVQLLSLIPNTLGVKLEEVRKVLTPYGCRFQCTIEVDDDNMTGMLFAVHFKDNNKVKNKKRWSQVMYMNYVINHRVTEDNLDLNNTFILTTDADIDFKAKSAVVLLDMLARDPHVGAVSSRTHPKGSGLLYWYQVFDYAMGHWLQKPAEHILGCVLCCPGCFSIFRCSALKDCLKIYSEEVTGAFDFLTKDMGEDRWLCTLLVEKGWRLEYCAISKDETFCPEEFDEFFKQRRRWIPSTVANLWLLVSSARKITHNNKTINYLFIFYQLLIILSTIISPATVILIISASLAQEHANQAILTVFLVIISVLYGLVCLYTNQKTQLDFAKLLTLFFAILMVVVVVGLIKGVVDDIESLFVNQTANEHFKLPVDVSTLYSGFFALVFPITAILHYREWWCLLQCIWYLLGLPGGYLVLIIYSAANLNSRSWGTREAKSNDDTENLIIVLYKKLKRHLLACTCCWKEAKKTQSAEDKTDKDSARQLLDEINEDADINDHTGSAVLVEIANQARDDDWITDWLDKQNCSLSRIFDE